MSFSVLAPDGQPRSYLDWNSTTKPSADVLAAMAHAQEFGWGNPASVHTEGRAARAILETARVSVADLVGARPMDVTFTSGGTEATNMALFGAFDASSPVSRPTGGGPVNLGVLLVSAVEHASVLAAAARLAERGVSIRTVRVNREGLVDLDHLDALLADRAVKLASIQAANGETGVLQPLAEIARRVRAAGALMHVDAVQAVGRVSTVNAWIAHADMLTLAAHKMCGPKGIGALVTAPGVAVRSVLSGGSQERGMRPGTQDAVLAAGFGAAARGAMSQLATYQTLAVHRDALERGLMTLGGLQNGSVEHRLAHVCHMSFPGWSSPELVAALDLDGVACSGGSACHAGIAEASATLRAMFESDPADHVRMMAPVRFSLPPWTDSHVVQRALSRIAPVLGRNRHKGATLR